MNTKPLKIVIVGGGAAGVFAAASFLKNCNGVEVVMIHDPKIPYIGVGESLGFTSRFFMRDLLGFERDEDWLVPSRSTFKHGVVHHGFDGTDTPHYSPHFFQPSTKILNASIIGAYKQTIPQAYGFSPTGAEGDEHSMIDIWLHLYAKGLRRLDQRESDLSEMYWYMHYKTMPDPHNHDNKGLTTSFHINADYVKDVIWEKICTQVTTVSKNVQQVKVENDRITKLIFDDGEEIVGDLYIDCTGFKRLLAKALPFKWNKVDEEFNNVAIVGQGPNHDGSPIPSVTVTEHFAMDHGWVFSLPMPERSGNGYLFNTRIYDREDEIVEEFNKKFPYKKDCIKRRISWEPGFYENNFVGNCITLGISTGFIDPYDANGFTTSLQFISKLTRYIQHDHQRTFEWQSEYNSYVLSVLNDAFLRIKVGLWLAPKNNTKYWHVLHDAARRNRLVEQLRSAVHDARRKHVNPSTFKFLWSQGVYMNHALYYGIDLDIPVLPISETTEQLAINFFDFFSNKNQIQARASKSVKQYYKELYNLTE
jgi:hypothetical protein